MRVLGCRSCLPRGAARRCGAGVWAVGTAYHVCGAAGAAGEAREIDRSFGGRDAGVPRPGGAAGVRADHVCGRRDAAGTVNSRRRLRGEARKHCGLLWFFLVCRNARCTRPGAMKNTAVNDRDFPWLVAAWVGTPWSGRTVIRCGCGGSRASRMKNFVFSPSFLGVRYGVLAERL